MGISVNSPNFSSQFLLLSVEPGFFKPYTGSRWHDLEQQSPDSYGGFKRPFLNPPGDGYRIDQNKLPIPNEWLARATISGVGETISYVLLPRLSPGFVDHIEYESFGPKTSAKFRYIRF